MVLAAFSGFGFGSATAFIAQAADGGVVWTVLSRDATIVALTIPVLVRHSQTLAERASALLALVALSIGVIDVAGTLLLAYATTLGLVSLVGVVASLYPVVTVLLERWILRLGEGGRRLHGCRDARPCLEPGTPTCRSANRVGGQVDGESPTLSAIRRLHTRTPSQHEEAVPCRNKQRPGGPR